MSKAEHERLSPRPAFVAQYGSVLKRQGWLIALIVVCAVAGAVAITAVQTPVYQASMKIVVGQGNGFFQPQFGSSVQPFTQTMTSLLESDIVARRVIQSQKIPLTPMGLLSHLHVASNAESPVVGVIPQVASAGRRPGPARRQDIAGNHAMLEAFYMLRANLEFSEVGAAGQIIAVTSAVPNEGKSTVAASLAAVLALSGKNVI